MLGGKKRVYLGSFQTELEAARAFRKAVKKRDKLFPKKVGEGADEASLPGGEEPARIKTSRFRGELMMATPLDKSSRLINGCGKGLRSGEARKRLCKSLSSPGDWHGASCTEWFPFPWPL